MKKESVIKDAKWKKAYLNIFYSTPKKIRTNIKGINKIRSDAKIIVLIFPEKF